MIERDFKQCNTEVMKQKKRTSLRRWDMDPLFALGPVIQLHCVSKAMVLSTLSVEFDSVILLRMSLFLTCFNAFRSLHAGA